jgi:hypothetical protein
MHKKGRIERLLLGGFFRASVEACVCKSKRVACHVGATHHHVRWCRLFDRRLPSDVPVEIDAALRRPNDSGAVLFDGSAQTDPALAEALSGGVRVGGTSGSFWKNYNETSIPTGA